MKHIVIIVSLFSITLLSPLSYTYAQNIDSLKITELNVDYENKIEEQQKKIATLQKNVEKLKLENESFKVQVDKKNIKYLKRQIDSLNNSTQILRDSIFVAENAIKELRLKLDSTDNKILSLKEDIALLTNIKEQYVQSKVDEVNNYLIQPYRALSDSTFTQYIKTLTPISNIDNAVKELLSLLDIKYENYKEYKSIENQLINNTYTKQSSQELDCRIDTLIKLSNPDQIKELNLLKESIAAYPRAISEFQFFVKAIRDQVDFMRVEMPSSKDIEDANSAVKMVLENNKNRLERSYKYSITKVQRLKNQYDKYLEIISINSLSKEAVLIEEEILSLLNN